MQSPKIWVASKIRTSLLFQGEYFPASKNDRFFGASHLHPSPRTWIEDVWEGAPPLLWGWSDGNRTAIFSAKNASKYMSRGRFIQPGSIWNLCFSGETCAPSISMAFHIFGSCSLFASQISWLPSKISKKSIILKSSAHGQLVPPPSVTFKRLQCLEKNPPKKHFFSFETCDCRLQKSFNARILFQ